MIVERNRANMIYERACMFAYEKLLEEKTMSEKTTIVIAEDNPDLRRVMRDYLKTQEDLEVIGCAADGNQALEMVRTLNPDIVLLDLIMPNHDGFSFLEDLSRSQMPRPEIIVTSAIGQEDFIRRAIDLGAKYYMVKPYDMEVLVKRIRQLMLDRQALVAGNRQSIQVAASRSLDERITSIFLMIGIPAHIKGYTYLREAVKMVIANKDIINRITKELYPGIAKVCDTTASKVERAIRHAIEVAFSRGRIENINQVFGINIYSRGDKPTNGEFIALIADKLSMENRQISA